jgi:hypothetical protein
VCDACATFCASLRIWLARLPDRSFFNALLCIRSRCITIFSQIPTAGLDEAQDAVATKRDRHSLLADLCEVQASQKRH